MNDFKAWAVWFATDPVSSWSPGFNSGSTESAILAGKGKILPGAPKRSGRHRVSYTTEIASVEKFLIGRDRKVILVFLLYDGTMQEKADLLGVSRRQMVRQVMQIHSRYLDWKGTKTPIYNSPKSG